MNDDLNKALAELRRVTPPSSPWEAGDFGVGSTPVDYHIATILNAVASGDLIPRADAELAVALMVEKAATHVRTAEVPREETGEGAMQRALLNYAADVVSLCAPASALAELQALRDDVTGWISNAQVAREKWSEYEARAEAAEAELVTLRAQVERLTGLIQWAHDTLWELNPGNYGHDDVCKVNDAAVEVILGLAPIIGETHGHSVEWWEASAALTEGAAP